MQGELEGIHRQSGKLQYRCEQSPREITTRTIRTNRVDEITFRKANDHPRDHHYGVPVVNLWI